MLTTSDLDAAGGTESKNILEEIIFNNATACMQHRNPVSVVFPLWQRRSYSTCVSFSYNSHELLQVHAQIF